MLLFVWTGSSPAPKTGADEGEGTLQQTLGKPFVEVQWEMLHHNPSILYFRALLLQIQVSTPVWNLCLPVAISKFMWQASSDHRSCRRTCA